MTTESPRPFTIQVADDVLVALRERLHRVRWPDEIPDAGWRYGTDLSYRQELAAYWRDRYDWRSQEAQLNRFRQYTVAHGGIDLHFIHEPGIGPHPLPLLLSHGWPGSIVEFQQLIPRLTDPARFGGDPADAFTVVAPSPPGYAEFPREILHPPRSLADRVYNIQRWTRMACGGHFAALEEPEALAVEIRAFFRDLRP